MKTASQNEHLLLGLCPYLAAGLIKVAQGESDLGDRSREKLKVIAKERSRVAPWGWTCRRINLSRRKRTAASDEHGDACETHTNTSRVMFTCAELEDELKNCI